MRSFQLFISAVLFGASHLGFAIDLPVHPDDAKVIQGIITTEAVDVDASDMPGYAKTSLFKILENCGVDPKTLKTSGIALKSKPGESLNFAYTPDGRVVALQGNGAWLRNSSLRELKAMTELRSIRFDHNGYLDKRGAEFDGSGYDALADSKIADIKIGMSFNDKGMEQCAKIKTLRYFSVGHSRITEAGIAFFAGHPGITAFSVSEMGQSTVTERALAVIAKIPKLTHLGFKECYVTYAGGFAYLVPLKGQLVELDLTMSVASPADLEKLQADHPGAKIITIPPAEIAKRHKGVAANLVKQLPPELAAPIKAALGQ